MAEPKTKKTSASVAAFLDAIPDATMREDSRVVATLMKKVTKAEPKMWGTSIVGFGNRPYTGASGKSVDWPLVAFSPRKAALTLYIMDGIERHASLARTLGKYSTGKACLYIKRLSDIDLPTLEKIVKESVARLERSSA
jgi:hypothetical protein